METLPLTPSKIVIPRRRGDLLSRPRLLKWFDDLIDYKLFIVAAPAGYGKTSLLIDFANSTQLPVCWFSLDVDDQDPLRFFSHFIQSIHYRFPEFGERSLGILSSLPANRIDREVVTSIIINELFEKISEHFVIILDDFHLVEKSKPINDFINDFIQDVDENCHLITASRTLLTLADMPLFVAHSEVSGLSFAELAFESDEILKLFKQNYAKDITPAEAEKLAQETEGWITGLLLSSQLPGAGVTDQLRIARISGVGLYEYLAQQVLNQQPQTLQKALLRTSLLDEFDADLCYRVIGKALNLDQDWGETINVILTRNLFVLPVGEEQISIRYHHLFRDFLRNKMKSSFPFEAEKIQLELADYYQENAEWERAYQIYSELHQEKMLVSLVDRSSTELLKKGRFDVLSRWMDSIPVQDIDSSPKLLSVKGSILINTADIDSGLIFLKKAKEISNTSDPSLYSLINNRLATGYRMKGQFPDAINLLKESLIISKRSNEMKAVDADTQFILGVTYFFSGNLDESLISLQNALDSYEELKDISTAYKVESQIATVLRNLGKYSRAEQAYNKALEYCVRLGNILWQGTILNSLGILLQLLGEYEKSLRTFEKALEYATLTNSTREKSYTLASIGDLYVEIGAIVEAKDAYRLSFQLASQTNDQFLIQYLDMANVTCKRLEGDVENASRLCDIAMLRAEKNHNILEINHCHLEKAIILSSEKRYKEIPEELEGAKNYYKTSGYLSENVRVNLLLMISYFFQKKYSKGQILLKEFFQTSDNVEFEKMALSNAYQLREPLIQSLRAAGESIGAEKITTVLENYHRNLVHIRSRIRPQAVSIPITPIALSIKCLGKTEVRINNTLVTSAKWQAQIARDLFIYLVLHPEGATKEQIGLIFWPGSSQEELKLRFKNAIYRLRRAVEREMILFINNIYLFNSKLDHDVDVLTFQSEVEAGRKASHADARYEHFENALKVFAGEFLPDTDLEWANTEREYLSQIAQKVALELANYKLKTKQLDQAQELCERVINDERTNEEANMLLMKIFAARMDRKSIKRQFEGYKKYLDETAGIRISKEIQSLYETLIK